MTQEQIDGLVVGQSILVPARLLRVDRDTLFVKADYGGPEFFAANCDCFPSPPSPDVPEGFERFWPGEDEFPEIGCFAGSVRIDNRTNSEVGFKTSSGFTWASVTALKSLGVPFYRPIKKEAEGMIPATLDAVMDLLPKGSFTVWEGSRKGFVTYVRDEDGKDVYGGIPPQVGKDRFISAYAAFVEFDRQARQGGAR